MKRIPCLAPFVLLLPCAVATAQDFSPVVVASIHDEPPDGMGDLFNAPPFEGLLRKQTTREDRAIQEFDVSSLAGQNISSATLTGRVSVNNAFDNGLRTFDFLIYDGNGTAELSDYQIPATLVGSDSYAPPTDTSFDYSFDVTAAVGTLIANGSTFIGLRVDPTSNPNFPNILDDTLSVLSITIGGGVGSSYCFGDGSGTTCPCGNNGIAGHGCANSATSDGAQLSGAGSGSAGAGNLVLQASDLPSNQPGLYFQGDLATNGGAGAPFGDGLRCAGTNVVRLQTVTATGSGTSATSLDVAAKGGVSAGDTKRYQLWYRDPSGGPCGTDFNLSQGLEIVWMP